MEEQRQELWGGVAVEVNYRSTKEFLSTYCANISGSGIFIRTQEPQPLNLVVRMRFTRPSVNHRFVRHGTVAWANPSPKKRFLPADMRTNFTDLAGEAKKPIEESVNKNTGPAPRIGPSNKRDDPILAVHFTGAVSQVTRNANSAGAVLTT